MESQSKYYLSSERCRELLDDYIRDKKELAELLGVHPSHTLMMRAVQDLLEDINIPKTAKRIRCFYNPSSKDHVWEAHEDGRVMYYADDLHDAVEINRPTLKELESFVVSGALKEYEAWELDEPEELYTKRIRCFCEKKPENQIFVWEFYEDGSAMFYSDLYPDGTPCPGYSPLTIERAEEMVHDNHWIEYEAWELDEPLPSDYPKYTLRHNE